MFREGTRKKSFKVMFDCKKASKGYKYGDIAWFDGSHHVRIIYGVCVVVGGYFYLGLM